MSTEAVTPKDPTDPKNLRLNEKGRANLILKKQALVHLDEAIVQLDKMQDLMGRIEGMPRMEPFFYQIRSIRSMLEDMGEALEEGYTNDMMDDMAHGMKFLHDLREAGDGETL